jgi:hypothetical protein
VVNWLRRKQCEHLQRAGCAGIGNVASSCEVAGTAMFIGSFLPESAALTWLTRAGGAAAYAGC